VEHELTIEQFVSYLAGRLIVIAPYRTDPERVCDYLLEKGNMSFSVKKGEFVFRPKHYFQVYFQSTKTYLHFTPESSYRYIDLRELIRYALEGDSDSIFVKYLLI